jgi:quercetin dioxygenase-like cupin family protein
MFEAGTSLENPVTGERLVLKISGDETNGEYLQADYWLAPGGGVAAPHIHPLQEESFEVIWGSVVFLIDGEEHLSPPGTKHVVSAGTSHQMINRSDEEVHIFSELRPALRSEELLQTVWGLAADGKTNDKGFPGLLQIAVTAEEFRPEIHFAHPPLLVQRIVFGALAPLGRALGRKGAYVPLSK